MVPIHCSERDLRIFLYEHLFDPKVAVKTTEIVTLAGGCFWCLEAVYRTLPAVKEVTSGFIGGTSSDPTYRQVCAGDTGHAEALQIEYDPDSIGLAELLAVFFASHDPTTLNRQGNDVGTQYRSGIFYHTEEQRQLAEAIIDKLNSQGLWPHPIVTELTPASRFYPAGEEHQSYFARHPGQPYCQAVIVPKIRKIRAQFPDLISAD